MNKKILVLAPHPDDELLIAGALIYTVGKKKYDITVGFYTNGDARPGLGEIRVREAIESLRILGLQDDNIVFLGYGNNWEGGIHIYNLPDQHELMSCSGHNETYCLSEHPEYCMERFGIHHAYTRQNIKHDLKTLITDIHADLIVCVDYDSHPDHRALSLFFEEVMADIIKTEKNYTPIVLKKFAYAGMAEGSWDYYNRPMLETQIGCNCLDQTCELDNPVYRWEERIQLKIDRRTRTRYLHNNILYKAASKHKSQNFSIRVGKFANADIVYWQRRTDGISYYAKVTATSGRASYVNDFKMFDCSNILNGEKNMEYFQDYAWIPEEDDIEKKLFFDFPMPVKMSKFYIYENFIPGENILKARVLFDTGYVLWIDNLDHCGKKTELSFESQYNVKHIEFEILEYEGTQYGLTEFEIYEEDDLQLIPLELYNKSKQKTINIENKWDILIEKKLYHINPDYTHDNKYYRMFQFLVKWDSLNKDCIEKWLYIHGYKKIGIYGMGDFGRKVCRDLLSSKIEIKYGIDKMAGLMTAEFPLVHPDSILSELIQSIDVIIVTIITNYQFVKKHLITKGYSGNRIVSLEEIIIDSSNY